MRHSNAIASLPEDDLLKAEAYRLAFDDPEFLSRREARGIRFQLEMLKPDLGMQQAHVHHTIVVFGSARFLPPDEAARRLRALRSTVRGRSIVVGANIGKTKAVALDDAVEDYRYSASRVARWVDYLVVNVSSPNTPGLRDLQNVKALRPILAAVREAADAAAHRHVPLLVKIAPDLADEDIDAVADLVLKMGLDGVVATNTTVDHDLGEGGLSGAPLLPRSLEVVRRLRSRLGEGPTIIGVGGISSIMDAELMLDAGADLLQAYTAFIYNGPAWPGRINRALATIQRPR